MISFRLSAEEYQRFAKLCSDRGVRSLSDMARVALQSLVAAGVESDPLAMEVQDLRSQLKAVANEVDRIAGLVENRKSSKASG